MAYGRIAVVSHNFDDYLLNAPDFRAKAKRIDSF